MVISDFRELAKNGQHHELEDLIFNQGYFYKSEKPQNLARNAFVFFLIYNHLSSIEFFFSQSQLKNHLSDAQIKDCIRTLIIYDQKKMFELAVADEKFNNEIQTNIMDYFHLTCQRLSKGYVFNYFIEKLHILNIIQPVELLDSFRLLVKHNNLDFFIRLEKLMINFKYNQEDDILMKTASIHKSLDIMEYLLLNKKIRITKHINSLAVCDQNVAKLIEKRKANDRIEHQIKKLEEKINHISIENKNTIKKI